MNRITTLTAALSIAVMPSFSASAADGTWRSDSGSGTWSDSSRWDGAVAGGSGSIASFALPATAGEYDLTLDTNVILAELRQLGSGWSSTYRINGAGSLSFDTGGAGPAKITLSSTETSGAFLRSFVIDSSVQGSSGLEITGSGRRQYVAWNPSAMNLTGGITLRNAGLQVASGAALGTNSVTLQGNGLSFLGFSETGGTYSQSIILDSTTSGLMNFVPHGSVASDPPTHTISGPISQSAGGNKGIFYMTSTNTVGGARFIVSGNNTYSGTTTIGASQVAGVNMNTGPVVVRAAHANAFGSGTNAVIQILSAASGIELEGGITISGKTARLNGAGFREKGSINSVQGHNTWSGNVVLRYGTDRGTAPTIGVESDTLTVTGVISDGNTSNGLQKVGDGTLILTQANTYITGTTIREGTVQANHNSALGSGTVTLDGGALIVAAGRTVGNTISFGASGGTLGGQGRVTTALSLTSTAHRLSPGVGTLEIDGAQTWSGFSYLWSYAGEDLATGFSQIDIDGSLALAPAGSYHLEASFFEGDWLDTLAPGAGHSWTILSADELTGFDAALWTLSGFDSLPGGAGQWTLAQDGQSITLSYQAIPEPSSLVLLGFGVMGAYGAARRKWKTKA